MIITIEFSTANAAFDSDNLQSDDFDVEVTYVLDSVRRYLSDNRRQSNFCVGILDSNGNSIGTVKGNPE